MPPDLDFTHTYRVMFGVVLLVGGGAAVALLAGSAVAASLPMAIVGAVLALIVLGFLASNAFIVALHDGEVRIRTGLGRSYRVPVRDLRRGAHRVTGTKAVGTQLSVRWPGKRVSVTIPKYPQGPTQRLLTALELAQGAPD